MIELCRTRLRMAHLRLTARRRHACGSAHVTKNLMMAGDPACLFIDVNTLDGRATGLIRDSVVS